MENRRQVRHEYQTIRAPEGSIKGAKIQTILGFARASKFPEYPIFEVLLADRAFGVEPCWKTRPIARWQMATAKFGFITLFTVLLPGAFEFFAFTGQGVPVAHVGKSIAHALLGQIFAVGLMVICATGCRRSALALSILGPLSIGAPFMLVGVTFKFIRWLTAEELWEAGWHEPPDFTYPPPIIFGESVGIPPAMLLGFGLCWLAYLRPVQKWWFAGVVATVSLPGLLMLAAITAHNLGIPEPWITPDERPRMTTNTMSTASLGLRLEWQAVGTNSPLTQLKPTWNVPLFTDQTNRMVVTLPGACWARLAQAGPLARQGLDYWTRSSGTMPPVDYLGRSLTQSNGPLTVLLGPVLTLVSPPEMGVTTNEFVPWSDDGPLPRWPSTQISFVVGASELEVVVAHRARVRDLPPGLASRAGQPPSVGRNESDGLVISSARAFVGYGDEGEEPFSRKAVLWHPQRRELRLPQTSVVTRTERFGVLAFGSLGQVQTEQHQSTFPRPPTMLAGVEREWLAEAELLLLAFKPVGYGYHVILVPDAKLPPVPVAPVPEPRKP